MNETMSGKRDSASEARLVTVWTSDTDRAPGASPATLAMPVSVEEPLLCHVEGGRGEREHWPQDSGCA